MPARLLRFARSHSIGLLALFVALGGTAWAAGKIGTNDIKPNAVKSKQIAPKAVGSSELDDEALRTRHIGDGQVTGDTIRSGSITGRNLASGSVRANAIAGLPRAEIFSLDPQTFDSGVQDVVAADTIESLDSDAYELTSTSGQIEIQTPGIYEISGMVAWDPAAAGDRYLEITLSPQAGGTVVPAAQRQPAPSAASPMSVSTTAALDLGDIVSLSASQTSGSDLDLDLNGDTLGARLAIQYLSGEQTP